MNDNQIEQEIQAKGLTAPRVTPADIEANISCEWYFTGAQAVVGAGVDAIHAGLNQYPIHESLHLLTFCVLTLKNGFTVTGESACASPENFDAEIGRQIARQNAVNKVWPLMGYALKQELHRRAVFNAEPKVGYGPGAAELPPHQQRVIDEKAGLDAKLAKLGAFMGTPTYFALDVAECRRLGKQVDAMRAYSDVLGDRIAAF